MVVESIVLKDVKVQFKFNSSRVSKTEVVIWPLSGLVKLVDDNGVLYCSFTDVFIYKSTSNVDDFEC